MKQLLTACTNSLNQLVNFRMTDFQLAHIAQNDSANRSNEKPAEKPTEKPADKPADRPKLP